MRIRTLLKKNLSLNATMAIMAFILTALISSGIFLLANFIFSSALFSFLLSQIIMLSVLALAAYFYSVIKSKNDELERPRTEKGQKLDISDSNWSTGMTDSELTERIVSLSRNSRRLFAVEEQLSSRFRPKHAGDNYTKQLVCQLKICASRLKNDLDELKLEKIER